MFAILGQAVSGLKELHRIGFNHRDIKPANLLLWFELRRLPLFGFFVWVRSGPGLATLVS